MLEKQNGNVLFIILLSIALFAGLTYAVVQSSRQNISIMNEQEARIKANEIIQYASAIERAVARLTNMKGCNNIVYSASDTSSCGVFSPNGGRIPYKLPDKSWLDQSYQGEPGYGQLFLANSGNLESSSHKVRELGSDKAETMLHINYLPLVLCEALNKTLKNNFGSPPPPTQGPEKGSTGHEQIYGKSYGCTGTGDIHYQYYHVLTVR